MVLCACRLVQCGHGVVDEGVGVGQLRAVQQGQAVQDQAGAGFGQGDLGGRAGQAPAEGDGAAGILAVALNPGRQAGEVEGLGGLPLDPLVVQAGVLAHDHFGHGAGEVAAPALVLLHQGRAGIALQHHEQPGQGGGGLPVAGFGDEQHVKGRLHPDPLGDDDQGAVLEPGGVELGERVGAAGPGQGPQLVGQRRGGGQVHQAHPGGQVGGVAAVRVVAPVDEHQPGAARLRQDQRPDVHRHRGPGGEFHGLHGGQVGVLPGLLAGAGPVQARQRRFGPGAPLLPARGAGLGQDRRQERGPPLRGPPLLLLHDGRHHALPAGAAAAPSPLSQS